MGGFQPILTAQEACPTYWVMVSCAAVLWIPPTETNTGCEPSGPFEGTGELICPTTTDEVDTPTKSRPAFPPPTVTVTVPMGAGRSARDVPAAGVAPVETEGDTAPAPVMYKVSTWPGAAVVKGTGAPPSNVKIPGAAAATLKL